MYATAGIDMIAAGERANALPATSRRQPFTEVNMGAPRGIRNGKHRHGHNGADGQSPTYKSWDNMISRCMRQSHGSYWQYGGQGITVCERWLTFANFLVDMGERPPGKSIDRIDNSRGYEPGNCRWATHQEQIRNSRKVKAIVRSDGKRYATAIDAAHDVGVDYAGIVKCCRGQRKSAGRYGWYYATVEGE